jgi:hypothetical protein
VSTTINSLACVSYNPRLHTHTYRQATKNINHEIYGNILRCQIQPWCGRGFIGRNSITPTLPRTLANTSSTSHKQIDGFINPHLQECLRKASSQSPFGQFMFWCVAGANPTTTSKTGHGAIRWMSRVSHERII